MDSPSAPARIPASILVNKAIQESMVIAAHRHNVEIDAFVNGTTSTNTLILEVFKGLIASKNA